MTNRVQTLRSSVAGNRPPAGHQPGELYVNWPDAQFGVINAASNPQDLIAVRFFSTGANYNIGDHVLQGGILYKALVQVSPGPFNSTQWGLAGGGVTMGDTAPTGAQPGALWWDSVGGNLYVWYNDGTSSQWVIAVNSNSALANYVAKAGDTMSGDLIINSPDSYGLTINAPTYPGIRLNKPITGAACWIGGYRNNLQRWEIDLGNNTAETGSNVGSDFAIWGYNDAGVANVQAMTIYRATGNASFSNYVQVNGGKVQIFPGSGNPSAEYYNASGASLLTTLFFNMSTNNFTMQNVLSNAVLTLAASGNATVNNSFIANNQIDAIGAFCCRQGTNGAKSNQFSFWWDGAGHLYGYVDTSNMGYVTFASDYRIKKDVKPLGDTWERVKKLKPVSYSHKDYTPPNAKEPLFKADDKERWGFVAHELQETLIENAASGVKDSPTDIQSPNPWTIIAALTKTLQEAMARIEALEGAR